MQGMNGVLCALPYYYNFPMARLAVEAGIHFTDLGGNTAIVTRQRSLDGPARARGVSVVPDTGLAPGMVNVLAQAGIQEMESADSARMWVGGLPQYPKPPLNYQIVYSFEGVLDYYVTPAVVLMNGKRTTVEALSGLELLDFPQPLGQLEAFYTGGGASTLPHRYEGRIAVMEYKTLRYPGHARIMRAIRDLGLLSDEAVEYDGIPVNPRKFFIRQITPLLTREAGTDLVVARVEVTGRKDGGSARVRYEVTDYYDPVTRFTAMARTTGFSLSITALMQVRGALQPGVRTPDEGVPAAPYVNALMRRGIQVVRTDDRPGMGDE